LNARAASEIAEGLDRKVERVGVFVNASVDEVIDTTIEAHLDAVQLHGDETNDYCERLREKLPVSCRIIKAVRVKDNSALDDLKNFAADALLLDAWQPGIYGGTGRTIDYELARRAKPFTAQLFLAGGLNAKNVAGAVGVVRPYAVDVCSGVEVAPGRKSHAEIAEFIREVRRASDEL
jgi:phosphoribosylanthranilate isomerase